MKAVPLAVLAFAFMRAMALLPPASARKNEDMDKHRLHKGTYVYAHPLSLRVSQSCLACGGQR